jgi:hypothetical protein
MKVSSKTSFLWIGLVVAIVLGSLWQFFPLKDAQERLRAIPLKGAQFSGENVPLSAFEKDFFKKINIMKRVYKVGNQNAFIYGLDGTHNRHLVHDPSYCFRGSGFEIINQESFPVPGGEANLVMLSNGKETKQALYWFSDGASNFMSPMQYWLHTTLRRLTLGGSGDEPVLFMVQPIGAENLDWKALVQDFPELFSVNGSR